MEETDGIINFEKEMRTIEFPRSFWVDDRWIQPPVRVKIGDLVDVELNVKGILSGNYLGRYIGRGMGVVVFYNYATGEKQYIGRVVGRGIDRNPRLISDTELLELIED